MKFLIILLSCLIGTSLYSVTNFTLCIDGGGSKTLLQIVDHHGNIISLTKNGTVSDSIIAPGSNINNIGKDGLLTVLRTLVHGVSIGDKPLQTFLPECSVIAGMAGCSSPDTKALISSFFEQCGINRNNILIETDADLALRLVPSNGVVLIAGTGSICVGKKDDALYRVGGLGKVLGDEGSGHMIGLHALKAGLAEEYGWGTPTAITPALKTLFGVTSLKNLIRPTNMGELPVAKLAQAAPIIFELAYTGDAAAQKLLTLAARELRYLVTTLMTNAQLTSGELHLWGGLFKNIHADAFIKQIVEGSVFDNDAIIVINHAFDNLAVLYARQCISQSSITLRR